MQKKLYCQECGETLTHVKDNKYKCPKCKLNFEFSFYDTVEELEKATGVKFDKEVPCYGTIQC